MCLPSWNTSSTKHWRRIAICATSTLRRCCTDLRAPDAGQQFGTDLRPGGLRCGGVESRDSQNAASGTVHPSSNEAMVLGRRCGATDRGGVRGSFPCIVRFRPTRDAALRCSQQWEQLTFFTDSAVYPSLVTGRTHADFHPRRQCFLWQRTGLREAAARRRSGAAYTR